MLETLTLEQLKTHRDIYSDLSNKNDKSQEYFKDILEAIDEEIKRRGE